MDVTDIHPYLIVLLGLDTFRESHGLGLHLAIRIKHTNGLHTCIGRHNLGKTAIVVVFELLDSNTTSETATLWQLAGMVEEVAVTFVVGHTTMVGKRVGITQRHNLASILPRACRRRGCAV